MLQHEGPGKMEEGSPKALWFQMWKSRDCCGDRGTEWRWDVGA